MECRRVYGGGQHPYMRHPIHLLSLDSPSPISHRRPLCAALTSSLCLYFFFFLRVRFFLHLCLPFHLILSYSLFTVFSLSSFLHVAFLSFLLTCPFVLFSLFLVLSSFALTSTSSFRFSFNLPLSSPFITYFSRLPFPFASLLCSFLACLLVLFFLLLLNLLLFYYPPFYSSSVASYVSALSCSSNSSFMFSFPFIVTPPVHFLPFLPLSLPRRLIH